MWSTGWGASRGQDPGKTRRAGVEWSSWREDGQPQGKPCEEGGSKVATSPARPGLPEPQRTQPDPGLALPSCRIVNVLLGSQLELTSSPACSLEVWDLRAMEFFW